MATLISAHQLTKSFASKILFSKISFAIDDQERIGLIGPNGAGKSTLLNIIAKKTEPDSGQLSFANNLRLSYLAQNPKLDLSKSIYECLISSSDDEYDSENIQLAFELISKLEIESLSGGSEKKLSELSGGWLKKVALAAELMKKPNLVLLDEPTNHLDLQSILWLEDFIQKTRGVAYLTVTHDRRFLQSTCNVIFDLNPQLPLGLLRTVGTYSQHLESKMMLLEGQKRLEEKRRNTMMREKEWLARGPQARLTKQKARIERAYDLIDEVKGLESQNTKRNVTLDFGNTTKSPKKLIEAKKISKSYDSVTLFNNFSVMVRPGHRYGLIGANGSGKSTLLKTLIGKIAPDSGEVQVNEDIEITYFEQGKDQIDESLSVLKCICPEGDYVHFQDQPVFARSYLSRFYFNSQQMDMPARQLSGGEKSRLILAKLMLRKSHVLILDEPTNDLDVETLEALTDCLEEFQGAVILVSHDRYFMDQNCDVIWAFDSSNAEIVTFADTYQWEEWFAKYKKLQSGKSTSKSNSNSQNSEVDTNSKSPKKQILTYKEKLEFEGIEKVISDQESFLAKLQKELAEVSATGNYAKLAETSTSIAETEKKIESLMQRWEYLSSKSGEQ